MASRILGETEKARQGKQSGEEQPEEIRTGVDWVQGGETTDTPVRGDRSSLDWEDAARATADPAGGGVAQAASETAKDTVPALSDGRAGARRNIGLPAISENGRIEP
jgi:hypothetical protein